MISLLLGWYASYLPMYRAEEKTLEGISRVVKAPVACTRITTMGPPGLEYVNIIYLPHGTLTDEQVDDLIPYLRELSGLNSVDIRRTKISPDALKRLQTALPDVAFGRVDY
ncbi:MAG: hypothetical protein JW818_06065 [Pirellulales bacterium]|nr:hypothetical protein [Pirellulales bacterium]